MSKSVQKRRIEIIKIVNGETLVSEVDMSNQNGALVKLLDPMLIIAGLDKDNKETVTFIPYGRYVAKTNQSGHSRTAIEVMAHHILYAQQADKDITEHYEELVLKKYGSVIIPEKTKLII